MVKKTNIVVYPLLLLMATGTISCGGPEPRRPVEVRSGSFFTESVERSKKRLAQEVKRWRDHNAAVAAFLLLAYLRAPLLAWTAAAALQRGRVILDKVRAGQHRHRRLDLHR